MNRSIFKLVKTCVSIIVIVLVFDVIFGQVMSFYSKRYGLPGDYAKIEYLFHQANEDVVIIGSSVAINSFMPDIMMDSLGISVFNGGCNAKNIIFFRCMIDGLLEHHRPRGVILALQPDDLSDDHIGRIELLNPYYGRNPVIDSALVLQNDGKCSAFLRSNLYKYNTVWFRIFLQSFLPREEMANHGFVAKHKPNNLPIFENYGDEPDDDFIYSVKLEYLKAIITQLRSNNVELVVVFPPYYRKLRHEGNPYSKRVITELCRENGIRVIDDNQMEYFFDRPELFYDNMHLNGDGARIFTDMFINQILKSDFYKKIKSKKNETELGV